MTDTHHVFVTEPGFYSSRWEKAFSDARVIHAVAEFGRSLPSSSESESTIVWILSTHEGAEPIARRAVASGHQVIVMSTAPSVDGLRRALKWGARGYINAAAPSDGLRQAAETVMGGGMWLPADFINAVLRVLARSDARGASNTGNEDEDKALTTLTDREHRVAETVRSGLSNKEIACQLGITERTVKAHLSAIFRKLDIRDRMQLAARMHRRHG